MSYKKYFSPAQVESDQKDIIIAQLKADIFELRKRDEDYYNLQDEYRKLEQKFQIEYEEKQFQENEFLQKHESSLRAMAKMKAESEGQLMNFREKNRILKEVSLENSTTKELCDQRTVDLSRLKNMVQDSLERNMQLTEEQQNLKNILNQYSDDKSKLGEQVEELKLSIQQMEAKNKELSNECNASIEGIEHLKQNTISIQNKNQQLHETLAQKISNIKIIDKEIMDTNLNVKNIKASLQQAENFKLKFEDDCRQFFIALQQEVARNKQMGKEIQDLESNISIYDKKIDEMKVESQNIEQQNREVADSNLRLATDLEYSKKYIDDLNAQNQFLAEQLNYYADQDEVIRSIIQRKNRIKELKSVVDQNLKFGTSIKNVVSKTASPVKGTSLLRSSYTQSKHVSPYKKFE